MPDIDPAALSRSGPATHVSTVSLPPVKPLTAGTPKVIKTISITPRIDLEPLYTSLKGAVGEHWVAYKEAISLFVLGQLNQAELSARIDHFITRDINTEHLHNQLLSAIYGNVTRDLPDHGVASWVSANDKPTNISKPVSGDAAEQRLKTEVMQLPARDRRRLKDIPPDRYHQQIDPHRMFSNTLHEYHQAKQIRIPDVVPASAGGLNKTNWDLEIRKRYSQPLASETGEFPDTESISARMIPICYEEGVVGGASDGTAAAMNVATETFIKEVLTGIFGRVRSNGPSYIMTSTYKRQLEHEEEGWLRGDIQKNGNSLLPIEQAAASQRPPLGMSDVRLALEMGDMYLGQMPLTVEKIMGSYLEGEFENYQNASAVLEAATVIGGEDVEMMNGIGVGLRVPPMDDVLSAAESDWGWEGGRAADREALGALLDGYLAVG
ncbi:MAG: transcriptional coactivator hfi1/ADA1 [Geoglossum simile]|nr:MAG: transcriptional coactivator hfi1/ADA1 [Geoglossum simile]